VLGFETSGEGEGKSSGSVARLPGLVTLRQGGFRELPDRGGKVYLTCVDKKEKSGCNRRVIHHTSVGVKARKGAPI